MPKKKEVSIMAKCQYCGGKGIIKWPNATYTCKHCGGSGKCNCKPCKSYA
ncbi:MAG: hypothetical protein AAB969_01270 [Patescibacteria group bacterium]